MRVVVQALAFAQVVYRRKSPSCREMSSSAPLLSSKTLDRMSPEDSDMLIGCARHLAREAHSGARQLKLRGKNIALLSSSAQTDEANAFREAVLELGARLAILQLRLSESSSAEEVETAARLLGRFYDAIECQGMDSSVVCKLRFFAGIPVFDALASAEHSTAALWGQLGDEASAAECRRSVIQAAVLAALA